MPRMPLCDIIRLGDRSLGRVLHFPVAKGPVFARGIYKADENVGLRDFSFDVNVIGDSPVEFLLYFGRSSSNPGDLNEDDVTRVLNAQVAVSRKDEFVGCMTRDDLELVVRGNFRDLHHRIINRLAYGAHEFGGCVLA